MKSSTNHPTEPRGQLSRRPSALPDHQQNCRSTHLMRKVHPKYDPAQTYAFSAPLRLGTPTPRPGGLDLSRIFTEARHALRKSSLRELRALRGENQGPAWSLAVPQGFSLF